MTESDEMNIPDNLRYESINNTRENLKKVTVMNKEQEDFFNELARIQEEQVNIFLIKNSESCDNVLKQNLESFSYEIIYKVMELLDGYYNSKMKYELKNIINNTVVNKGADLHDLCADYLKC